MVLASLSPGQYLGIDPCTFESSTSTRANTRAFKRPAKTRASEVSGSGSAALRNRPPAAATGAARVFLVRCHVIVRAAAKRACRSRGVVTGLRTSAADQSRIGSLARPATAASGPGPQIISSTGAGAAVLSCGPFWAEAQAARKSAASPAELRPVAVGPAAAGSSAVGRAAPQPTRRAAY